MLPYTAAVHKIFDRIVSKRSRHRTIARLAAFALLPAITASVITYTVKSGDTLADIAQQYCGQSADWTGIYNGNLAAIGHDPNLIYPGEHLKIKCNDAAIQAALTTTPNHPVAAATFQLTSARTQATFSGNGGMQACIIARESGGNPNIWNASGHWGLYQFSESTWITHGGSAASFGNASIAVQNQIYYNTVAQDGYSDWAPYDGC